MRKVQHAIRRCNREKLSLKIFITICKYMDNVNYSVMKMAADLPNKSIVVTNFEIMLLTDIMIP